MTRLTKTFTAVTVGFSSWSFEKWDAEKENFTFTGIIVLFSSASGFHVTSKVAQTWGKSSLTQRHLEKESGAALGRVDFRSGARSFFVSLMMLSGLPAPCHIASGLSTLLLRQKLPKLQLLPAHINREDGQRQFFLFFIAHFLLRNYCFPTSLFFVF